MTYLICGLCIVLLATVCFLCFKINRIHRATEELRTEFSARLLEDTNVGIDLSTSDRTMRRLAGDMDHALKQLRREHIRYAQGDQELKDAITNISHDLRTPLTAISGYLELMEREEVSPAVRGYLAIIQNRADVLKQLTEELFRYSIVVSVKQHDEWGTVCLNQVLEECIAGYYGALTERGISPEITLTQTRVERRLNAAALSRILGNMLNNAVKYSDGDLRIVLSDSGTITFSNHASALDEVLVGRLFDRFYTVEAGQHSTGLGLSIAKVLTEQLGGTISAGIEGGLFSVQIQFPQF